MGELQWSRSKWRNSTFVELNYAIAGYWRNWERFVGVPMREICFVQIAGNPNIKQSAKPHNVREYMKLSIDNEPEKLTKEEIENLKDRAKDILNKRR